MSKRSSYNLVWMDMEMTGLEPDHDVILEIATVITDKNLNLLDVGPCLAVHQSEARLKKMDKWNTDHHNASGLVERVRASKITTKKAEELTLEFIKQYVRPRTAPLQPSGRTAHCRARPCARPPCGPPACRNAGSTTRTRTRSSR